MAEGTPGPSGRDGRGPSQDMKPQPPTSLG